MRSNNNLRVGLFVSFLIILLGAFLFFVSGSTKIFADRYTLVTEWKDVSGLKEGAIVRLSGWDVGEVLSIRFASENKRTLVVHLSIEQKYKDLIRQCSEEQENPQQINVLPKVSSRARIDTVGILGDKLVTINMGDDNCKTIKEGGFIFSEEAIDIIEYAKKVTSIVNRLNSIGRKVDIMLGTEEDAQITSRSIANSVREMENMINEVKEGSGLIHALLYDKKLTKNISQSLNNLNNASSSLNSSMEALEKGEGVAHELLYGNNGRAAIKELRTASTTLSRLANNFEQSDSLAYAILFDPKQKEVLEKLNISVSELQKASESLNNGTGTAALFLRDPTLYEDLRTLVGGAKRNQLLRSFIRWTIQESEERSQQPSQK
jgi:phospholipid/cholesterol/gamma-HCH transport system substrate-binding protein